MKWAVPTSVQNIEGARFVTDIDADVLAVRLWEIQQESYFKSGEGRNE